MSRDQVLQIQAKNGVGTKRSLTVLGERPRKIQRENKTNKNDKAITNEATLTEAQVKPISAEIEETDVSHRQIKVFNVVIAEMKGLIINKATIRVATDADHKEIIN